MVMRTGEGGGIWGKDNIMKNLGTKIKATEALDLVRSDG
jgi:hypothetical protein